MRNICVLLPFCDAGRLDAAGHFVPVTFLLPPRLRPHLLPQSAGAYVDSRGRGG